MSAPASYTGPRIGAGIAALLMTIVAISAVATQFRDRFDPLGVIFAGGTVVVALLCWWVALRIHAPEERARMRYALVAGFVLGGIGFAAGFFGPILFAPEANQGPLLGIFVTGPLGFILGIIIGWIYATVRARRPKSE